jgi:hypothetical protein
MATTAEMVARAARVEQVALAATAAQSTSQSRPMSAATSLLSRSAALEVREAKGAMAAMVATVGARPVQAPTLETAAGAAPEDSVRTPAKAGPAALRRSAMVAPAAMAAMAF